MGITDVCLPLPEPYGRVPLSILPGLKYTFSSGYVAIQTKISLWWGAGGYTKNSSLLNLREISSIWYRRKLCTERCLMDTLSCDFFPKGLWGNSLGAKCLARCTWQELSTREVACAVAAWCWRSCVCSKSRNYTGQLRSRQRHSSVGKAKCMGANARAFQVSARNRRKSLSLAKPLAKLTANWQRKTIFKVPDSFWRTGKVGKLWDKRHSVDNWHRTLWNLEEKLLCYSVIVYFINILHTLHLLKKFGFFILVNNRNSEKWLFFQKTA